MKPDTQHRALPVVRYAVMIGDRFVNEYGGPVAWKHLWPGLYYTYETRRAAEYAAVTARKWTTKTPRVVAVALTVYWTELKEKGR